MHIISIYYVDPWKAIPTYTNGVWDLSVGNIWTLVRREKLEQDREN